MGNARELLDTFGKAITGSGDLERIFTTDAEFHDSMSHTTGIPDLERYLESWWKAFPDASISIGKVVESGDQAVGEMTYRGTQTGPLVGPAGEIPPTGKSVELRGAAWITIKDGKIARFDGYYDTMSMMVQLGLMPAPATA